ncbi:MAG: c-type cytochrome [Longimicrobiales bacterium]|nr:c-type cytochrome [Longimicrobiales bacterium]
MMLSRNWQAMAVAGLTAFAVACGGGDQAASETGMAEQAEAAGAESETMAQDVELPEGVTMEMVTQGRQLFSGQGGCHACHNPNATGTQLAPDLTDDQWINISGPNYDEIVALIKSGVPQPVEHPGPMPPMGGANLSDAQVDALAAYILTL